MDASTDNLEEIPRGTEPASPTIAELAAAVNGLATTMNGLVTMVQQLATGTQYAQQTAKAAGGEAVRATGTAANATSEAARAKFKPLKPDKFSGDGQPTVADWCDSMDDYLAATRLVDDPMIISHVSSYFNGKAKTWWRFYKERMGRGAVVTPVGWLELRALMLDQFSEKLQKRRAMDDLEGLRQKGSVREYTAEFQKIVTELPDLEEESVRYRYVLGLNPEIQQAVEQQMPTTLDRAIELASLADTIARRIVHGQGSGRPVVARAVRERPVAQPTPMELGGVATQRKCYNCDEVGHLAARCPHPKKQ